MKFVRVTDLDDPERCTASDSRMGQCIYKIEPGAKTCVRHGAKKTLQKQARERKRMYYLNKWQARVGELATSPEIKNLHDEIGIVRMMLEEILNQCKDAHELMIHSRSVINCVDKIQRLVETVDRMDARQALPPSTLINLAGEWVKIINVYIQDPEVLDELADKLIGTVDNVRGQQTIEESRSPASPLVREDERAETS